MYERIKKLCEENNTTITALCRQVTGSTGNLATWKKEHIRPEHLAAVAELFDVSVDYLLGKSPVRHGSMDIIQNGNITYAPIPIVGTVAAGYTAIAQTDIIGYELVDTSTLTDGYEYAWLKVKGDSMSPLILEGDLVLVRLQDEIDSGELAVVIVDEEDGVIKKVQYSTNKVTLLSENDDYPPRVFAGKDVNRLRIWGKAVEIKRKLN